jgi:hypothetical protein
MMTLTWGKNGWDHQPYCLGQRKVQMTKATNQLLCHLS